MTVAGRGSEGFERCPIDSRIRLVGANRLRRDDRAEIPLEIESLHESVHVDDVAVRHDGQTGGKSLELAEPLPAHPGTEPYAGLEIIPCAAKEFVRTRLRDRNASRGEQLSQDHRGDIDFPNERSSLRSREGCRCATNPIVGGLLRILLHPRNLSSKSVGDPSHQVSEVYQRLAEIKEDEHPAIGHRKSASEESYAAP